MSDYESLDDPNLLDLERQLKHITLAPSAGLQHRYLYACGQSAERARLRARLRAVAALAVMFACLSAGFGVALLNRNVVESVAAARSNGEWRDASAGAHRANESAINPRPPRDAATRGAQGSGLTAWAHPIDWRLLEQDPSSKLALIDVSKLRAERVLKVSDWSAVSDL